jgi:hypothetical protein
MDGDGHDPAAHLPDRGDGAVGTTRLGEWMAMNIPVTIKSNLTGRLVKGGVTPRMLLDMSDEYDLIEKFTECDCGPIGETYVVECNCDEEWMDCEVLIGDEVETTKL